MFLTKILLHVFCSSIILSIFPFPLCSNMPAGKKVQLEFYETFGLSGTAAVTSKTIAAPIERIKMVSSNRGIIKYLLCLFHYLRIRMMEKKEKKKWTTGLSVHWWHWQSAKVGTG